MAGRVNYTFKNVKKHFNNIMEEKYFSPVHQIIKNRRVNYLDQN